MSINVTATPIEISTGLYATRSQYPYAEINSALDLEFNCQFDDKHTEIIIITTSMTGEWFNRTVMADPIVVTSSQHGGYVDGFLHVSDPLTITCNFISPDVILEFSKKNWVKWSDIGNLDFTINRTNVAGERPLDWSGWVYALKKLGNKVIAYGQSGVSILKASERHYGLMTVLNLGLHSSGAITGTDEVHYFIDSKGQMWMLQEGLKLLDYSEFFSSMGDLVMSYDVENRLIYICDGTHGYIYSVDNESLGAGPVDVTGVGIREGASYVTAATDVVIPPFEICTDVFDMGTRKFKTIRGIEVGVDLTETMEASIDYRISKNAGFSSIGWHLVTPAGLATMYCYGLEFRFRLRVLTYEYFELDYLKINGMIHNYSYTENTLGSISERRSQYDS